MKYYLMVFENTLFLVRKETEIKVGEYLESYSESKLFVEVEPGRLVMTDKGKEIYLEYESNKGFYYQFDNNHNFNPCWYDYDENGRMRIYYNENFELGVNFDFGRELSK
jgi:hypothetical protein